MKAAESLHLRKKLLPKDYLKIQPAKREPGRAERKDVRVMSANLVEKPSPVNVVVVATCNRCHQMRSRRGGFCLTLDDRKHFLCARCLGDLEHQADLDFLKASDVFAGVSREHHL